MTLSGGRHKGFGELHFGEERLEDAYVDSVIHGLQRAYVMSGGGYASVAIYREDGDPVDDYDREEHFVWFLLGAHRVGPGRYSLELTMRFYQFVRYLRDGNRPGGQKDEDVMFDLSASATSDTDFSRGEVVGALRTLDQLPVYTELADEYQQRLWFPKFLPWVPRNHWSREVIDPEAIRSPFEPARLVEELCGMRQSLSAVDVVFPTLRTGR
ncbi:hypothetical protein [uncultured Abyssibacter sp.]|uniref:hypothetical protein n=1 Tax=uncultured Abyssibacter sp. TaxID=2320202 RepID=UPI0032B17C90